MKIVKVKILKSFTRDIEPRFIFKKGQISECLLNDNQTELAKANDGNFYKIISIKRCK